MVDEVEDMYDPATRDGVRVVLVAVHTVCGEQVGWSPA
jgi:hypothetical protein